MQLGRVNLEHGDLEAAGSRLAQALDAQQALGDRWGIVYSLNGLASVALLQGENAAAEGSLQESLGVAAETLERAGLAGGLELLGRLAVATDCPLRAARLYACASVVREVATVHPYQIDHSGHQSELALVRGRLGEEAFAEAWAEGRAMTLADALAYARREQDQREKEGVDV
jgi:hypothetical protein